MSQPHSRRPPQKKPSGSHHKPDKPFQKRGAGRQREALPEGVFAVEGVAAIAEYLRYRPSAVLQVFAKEKALKSVRETLGEFKRDIKSVSGDVEDGLPPTPAWAHVRHETSEWGDLLASLKKNPDRSPRLILVLDHISDPRNLGALVRSAAFFGVSEIIVPEKRQVLLTQSSVNTAQGGFALCNLTIVVNVARAVEELKEHGYWILGAAMGGESVRSVKGRFDKQVLVLGSEDKGISSNVLGKCDVVVAIPGAKRALESLNVSVAGGILIHELAAIS